METLPKIFKFRQKASPPRLEVVEKELTRQLGEFELSKKVRKGDRVGITAGSRGIKDMPRVLQILVRRLKEIGALPFIVPCMGSHGRGTAEGQVEVLKNLGITEESVGAPILSSMEVKEIGRSKFGTPVVVDRHLCSMDKIVVVNRVKPHTDFRGEIESGLMKMLVIGMGKHEGALVAHRLTIQHGYFDVILEKGRIILQKLPILLGIGIIENQYDETAFVELVKPEEFVEKEKTLLKKARNLMPGLPFDRMDLLIVDELGKNISGAGMDTNVIGRLSFVGSPKPDRPKITRIFVRDLSEATHGNASGIGMADYTTRRCVEKIDPVSTNVNCITSMAPEDARIPIAFDADREAVDASYHTAGVLDPSMFRVLWIKNTLETEYLFASQAFLEEARINPNLEILGDPIDFPFDRNGNLLVRWKEIAQTTR
jgi:hypothetical protein